MISCEFCNEKFVENMNGLVEKTFHELLHKDDEVNEKT